VSGGHHSRASADRRVAIAAVQVVEHARGERRVRWQSELGLGSNHVDLDVSAVGAAAADDEWGRKVLALSAEGERVVPSVEGGPDVGAEWPRVGSRRGREAERLNCRVSVSVYAQNNATARGNRVAEGRVVDVSRGEHPAAPLQRLHELADGPPVVLGVDDGDEQGQGAQAAHLVDDRGLKLPEVPSSA